MKAAQECSLEGVKRALAQGANVNFVAQSKSALILSYFKHLSKVAREEVIRELLSHGADPNIGDGDSFPLHLAIYRNDEGAVRGLLEKGARVEERDKQGRNAMQVAMISAGDVNQSIVLLLLSHGAKVDEEIMPGLSPLLHCLRHGNVTLAKSMLQHNASPCKAPKEVY